MQLIFYTLLKANWKKGYCVIAIIKEFEWGVAQLDRATDF